MVTSHLPNCYQPCDPRSTCRWSLRAGSVPRPQCALPATLVPMQSRVGTRFVATTESYAHPVYIEALVAAATNDSVLTEAFGVGWPNAPHRVLRSAIDAADAATTDIVGEVGGRGEQPMPIPRFGVSSPTRDTTGNVAAMALYAGRSVGAIDRVMTAAEVVTELAAGFH